MDLLNLPEEVLKLILHFIPLSQRLRQCSLVSKDWQRLTAAATVSVELGTYRTAAASTAKERWELLQAWLKKHSQHTESLTVDSSGDRLVVSGLPCQHLRKLDLKYCKVLLGSTEPVSDQPGTLSSCKKLTSLTLTCCQHPDCEVKPAHDDGSANLQHGYGYGLAREPPRESLAALTGLAGLQHLSLTPCSNAVLPEVLFLHLSNLTSLELCGYHDHISCAHLQHLTALSKLQGLALWEIGNSWAKQDEDTRRHFTKSTAPWLGKLTTLTALSLGGSALEPAVLSEMTQLQELRLNAMVVEGDKSDGSTELLHVLKRFTRLMTLQIDGLETAVAEAYRKDKRRTVYSEERHRWYLLPPLVYPAGQEVWPPSDPAYVGVYASLTASTLLKDLTLNSNTGRSADLGTIPTGIWAHLLRAGHVLPHLTRLSACVDAAAVNQLASCCPNLVALNLHCEGSGDEFSSQGAYEPGQIARLSELQRLTSLSIKDVQRPELKTIAGLTGLRSLQLHIDHVTLRLGDIELLTALKQLTYLGACDVNEVERRDGRTPVRGERVRYYKDCVWLCDITKEYTSKVSPGGWPTRPRQMGYVCATC